MVQYLGAHFPKTKTHQTVILVFTNLASEQRWLDSCKQWYKTTTHNSLQTNDIIVYINHIHHTCTCNMTRHIHVQPHPYQNLIHTAY